MLVSQRGIQPLRQITFWGKVEPSGFVADWDLVGSGEALEDCGASFVVGCLNTHLHNGVDLPDGINHQKSLDGVAVDHKGYFKRVHKRCGRPACPVCRDAWASREARRAEWRLSAFVLKGRNLKPIHIAVSVPREDYDLSEAKMRVKTYRALRNCKVLGGMIVFHPKRQKQDGTWFFSPHYHVVGYGWVQNVRENYWRSRYVVKNLRVRKTIGGTIWYQLSHAGLPPKRFGHVVAWFGCCSYHKLKVFPRDKEGRCPLCDSKLQKLVWIGEGVCPLGEDDGVQLYGDVLGWVVAPRDWGDSVG